MKEADIEKIIRQLINATNGFNVNAVLRLSAPFSNDSNWTPLSGGLGLSNCLRLIFK